MLSGSYLHPHEINNLAAAAQNHLDEFDRVPTKAKTVKITSLEQVRMKAPQAHKAVRKDTTANRLRTITEYLRWLGQKGTLRLDIQAATVRQQGLGAMIANFTAMIPKSRGRNAVGQREAPLKEVMDRLLAVIKPGAPDNPWDDLGLQIRNQLLIHLIYALGIRRGETLGIKIGDHIDFRGKRLLIARTPDDPEDPRRHQPATKTRDRWLPLKDSLIDTLLNYITMIRTKVPNARKHQFLFVSHQSGKPLSESGESKVFDQLRERISDLPRQLTNHVLRHAWNDAFSQLIDANKVAPEREAQMRSEIMGWSPTSGTAATYNRRKIREDADKFLREHQMTLSSDGRK